MPNGTSISFKKENIFFYGTLYLISCGVSYTICRFINYRWISNSIDDINKIISVIIFCICEFGYLQCSRPTLF